MLISKIKKTKSDKIKEFAANVHFLFTFYIGKIQAGLNCEYDGLSEVVVSLSHSRVDESSLFVIN